MKILEWFPFLAIATAVYISSIAAAPLDSENDKLEEDDSVVAFLPIIHYFTDGIPKYIQDIKEIIASSRPLETAIDKIRQILPNKLEVSVENPDELSIPLVTESLPFVDVPKLINGISINKVGDVNTPEATGGSPNSLGKAEETPTEKVVVMGEDPNQTFEEVLDWALKKLGFADTDAKSGIIIMEDPVLQHENEPEFRISDDDTNTVEDKGYETDLPIPKLNQPIFNVNDIREYENQDLQWIQ